jgi:hypothetical protein
LNLKEGGENYVMRILLYYYCAVIMEDDQDKMYKMKGGNEKCTKKFSFAC